MFLSFCQIANGQFSDFVQYAACAAKVLLQIQIALKSKEIPLTPSRKYFMAKHEWLSLSLIVHSVFEISELYLPLRSHVEKNLDSNGHCPNGAGW